MAKKYYDDYEDDDFYEDYRHKEQLKSRRDMKRKKNSYKEHFDDEFYDDY